ncbi:hypothetical protein, partial [Chitinibacter sp. ZOR0017]|uniref:hypothetical protein n=1 Tax=Chitinibacter sp. ZOR0017 TaxID=1339254 RepID=UPI0006457F37
MSKIHPQARTTPRVRTEIQASPLSVDALTKQYILTKATARKWKSRTDTQARSYCPHTLHTMLTLEQEIIVVELRRLLLLPLDDMLVITWEFINSAASRASLYRCFSRYGVNQLKDLMPVYESEVKTSKTFKL